MTGLSDGALHKLSAALSEAEISLGDGRYELLESIGRGAMGEVHRARDRKLERIVAIKICGDALDRERAERRFEREAKIVAALEHPSIPPVHDRGALADGRPYYVMRLVPGVVWDLAHASDRSLTHRLRTFLKLCEGVAYAHRAGFVHRDLKPENILLGPAGEVHVMDWGLATAVEGAVDREDARASAAGTPGYAAPEQERGVPARPSADVFSLGVLLERLTVDASGGAPAPLRSIVDQAKRPDPAERYSDAAALALDVARFLDREPVAAHRESWLERVARIADRHRVLIWLILGYLVMRAIVVLIART